MGSPAATLLTSTTEVEKLEGKIITDTEFVEAIETTDTPTLAKKELLVEESAPQE